MPQVLPQKPNSDSLVGQRASQVGVSNALGAELAAIGVPCLNPGHRRPHLRVLGDVHLPTQPRRTGETKDPKLRAPESVMMVKISFF